MRLCRNGGLEVERARYEAERAERRYRTVEPENRLVARGLETEWENRLRDLAAAEAELRRREQQRPSRLGPEQLKRIQILGSDIRQGLGSAAPPRIAIARNSCARCWKK